MVKVCALQNRNFQYVCRADQKEGDEQGSRVLLGAVPKSDRPPLAFLSNSREGVQKGRQREGEEETVGGNQDKSDIFYREQKKTFPLKKGWLPGSSPSNQK